MTHTAAPTARLAGPPVTKAGDGLGNAARTARCGPAGRQAHGPADGELAAVIAAFPGWRAWVTPGGELAAREGGVPPARAHARGSTLPELTRAIEAVIATGPPPSLRPAEQAALDVLTAAGGPLPVRAVSDASGLHISTAAKALAALHDRGLASRRRDGRSRLYTRAATASPPIPAGPRVRAMASGDGGPDTEGGSPA